MTDVLPDSRLAVPKQQIFSDGAWWEQIFCANNCGRTCGYVTAEFVTFAFWLCAACAEKYGDTSNGFPHVPDSVFWQKVKEAQLERYGRELTPPEVERVLDDVNDPLAKLIRQGG